MYLESNQIKLMPSQKRICLPIINRMVRKMKSNIRFADILTCEGVIVNGHHRYIASLIAGVNIGMMTGGMPMLQLSDWRQIEFAEEDWDTAADLMIINQRDASFNGLTLKDVIEIAG